MVACCLSNRTGALFLVGPWLGPVRPPEPRKTRGTVIPSRLQSTVSVAEPTRLPVSHDYNFSCT